MSAAAVIVMKQNRIIRRLRDLGAVSPETAVPLEQLRYGQSWIFRRLMARGVIVETKAGYYLDEAAAERFIANRWARMLIITAVLLVIALLVFVIAD